MEEPDYFTWSLSSLPALNFGYLQAARGWQYFAGRLVSNQSPQLAESCDRQQNVRLRWQRQPPTVTGFMAP